MTLASIPELANLAKIGQLKVEPPNAEECAGLLRSAELRLQDAKQVILSIEGRFDLAYNSAHSASLCALRLYGYRSENRYAVFQSLEHTIGFTPAQWLLLDEAHRKRNLAEYEGDLDITIKFVEELVMMIEMLIERVQKLIR